MATLTAPEKTTATEHQYPADSQVGLPTRENIANIEWEAAPIVAPAPPTAAPAHPSREDLMSKIVRPLLSFFDQLAGPPMTECERRARDLAETRRHDYTGYMGF